MISTQTHYHAGPQDYPLLDFSGYQIRATSSATKAFPPAPGDIKSILIIKMDAMGDYLLHTPFYAQLRKFYPAATITLLCHKMNFDMAALNPAFNHVITPPHEPGRDQRLALMYGLQLQAHEAAPFDLIILPRWTEDWHHAGFIAQAVDAPYRLTYSVLSTPFKQLHFPVHDDLFTHLIDDARPTHEVWRGMQLLHALGMTIPPVAEIKQELHTAPEDHAKIKTLLAQQNYPRPWHVFGIGASGEFKRWPGERFAELAKLLTGTIFVIGRGEADEQAAKTICDNNTHAVNLTGQLSPRESGVLIGECDIMICNDSFALHAAASMGTPLVEIVGQPADGNPATEYLPGRFGPWGAPFAWVQPLSCHNAKHPIPDFLNEIKCIGDISAQDIHHAVTEVLRQWPKAAQI